MGYTLGSAIDVEEQRTQAASLQIHARTAPGATRACEHTRARRNLRAIRSAQAAAARPARRRVRAAFTYFRINEERDVRNI